MLLLYSYFIAPCVSWKSSETEYQVIAKQFGSIYASYHIVFAFSGVILIVQNCKSRSIFFWYFKTCVLEWFNDSREHIMYFVSHYSYRIRSRSGIPILSPTSLCRGLSYSRPDLEILIPHLIHTKATPSNFKTYFKLWSCDISISEVEDCSQEGNFQFWFQMKIPHRIEL